MGFHDREHRQDGGRIVSEPAVYDYDDIVLAYHGIEVRCPNCGDQMTLRSMLRFGCAECDATARDVTIRSKE
jgi:Zn finger protein HypA/HybF involved in hydrogenase expression